MRLVDADEIKKTLGFADNCKECKIGKNCAYESFSAYGICTLLADSETVMTKPGWISVKDRLPNCNGLYLVWRPHFFGGERGEPSVCYFDGQDTWHDSYGVDFERILNPEDITHWMLLPEPPKEGI